MDEEKLKLKSAVCNNVRMIVLCSIGIKVTGAGLDYLQKSFTEDLDLSETDSRGVLIFTV